MVPLVRQALVLTIACYLGGFVNFLVPTPQGTDESIQAISLSSRLDSGLPVGSVRLPESDAKSIASVPVLGAVDYPSAIWVPAAATNYSVFNRPADYPIDMIVIHDIEGSATSAIKVFQDPLRHGSAHYVVSYKGKVWQMVLEKDVAWHAGNWDYNSRAIGIEHEGFAWTPGLYTPTEYRASAHIAASICSRWGVTLDRAHVIGHSEVPDPYHKGLFGGAEHHTDPGPYWNWTYYLGYARAYAQLLPSPPHMMIQPVAVPSDQSATVTWEPGRTCHTPIASYHVVAQPGNIAVDVPGNETQATITGLQNGVTYTFAVTAINSDGQSTLQSNAVIAGPHCGTASLTTNVASPQFLGTQVRLAGASTVCPNATYQFLLRYPNGSWAYARRQFGGASWTWDTSFFPAGTYTIRVWANQSGDPTSGEASTDITFTLVEPPPCTSASLAPSVVSQAAGSTVAFTAGSTGCPIALYAYWVQDLSGKWSMLRALNTQPTWSWNTTGLRPGRYTVHVWANHPGHSPASLEVVASSSVTLTAAPPCASGGFTTGGPSQPAGSAVTLTAISTGCASPLYEFWVRYLNGTWYLKQGWGGATFHWSTVGLMPGVYSVHAWAKQQGSSSVTYEALGSTTVTLTGCTSAGLAPASGSSAIGTPVAFTATSGGCPNPAYEYWLQWVDGTWHRMTGFGGAGWTWNTASGYSRGTYHIHAWANQQGAYTGAFETFGSSTYVLS